MDHFVSFSIKNAFASHGHNHFSCMGLQDFISVHALEHKGRLMFIGCDISYLIYPFLRNVHVGRRIQHDRHLFLIAAVNNVANGVHGNFMLQHNQVRGSDNIKGFIHHLGAHSVIGSFENNNAVVSFRQNDMSRTCIHSVQYRYIVRFHAAFLQSIQHEAAIGIAAYAAHHVNFLAQPGSCHGLVGTFAAGRNNQTFPHHRFTS